MRRFEKGWCNWGGVEGRMGGKERKGSGGGVEEVDRLGMKKLRTSK